MLYIPCHLVVLLVLIISNVLDLCLATWEQQAPLRPNARQPNIVFIYTDDQDLHMDSLSYMPFLKKHLIDRGTSFTKHYCTVALCCPSRVSMWTGKAAHNTNVTDLHPPWGGYPKFISQGFNGEYVPTWLQASGYDTYYIGKFLNGHSIYTYDSPHAAGWTGSDFLLDPYTYRYLNATFQRGFDKPVSYEGQYSTDVLANKTYEFLRDALAELRTNGKPFFLTTAPIAPHSNVHINKEVKNGNFTEKSNIQSPPIPAERHKHLFADARVPRTPNFNPNAHGGAGWISRLTKQNQTNIEYNDEWYRNRLRSLQAVDEMIDSLITQLSEAEVLDNTYIFFSTDNGYSIGQHRRQPGKQCAYEEDINVPFIVRGPGIAEGVETDVVTTHTDVAPTFLSLAGLDAPSTDDLDGKIIPLFAEDKISIDQAAESTTDHILPGRRQEHVNVEMWGIIMSEGKHGMVLYPNHTYKALRIIGPSYNLLYTIWCHNEHELYDMSTDPYQLTNLYDVHTRSNIQADSPPTAQFVQDSSSSLLEHLSTNSSTKAPHDIKALTGSTLSPLIHRLDSLLMLLKTCNGRQCTHPWESLFPEGQVQNLSDALHTKYDHYFEQHVPRVRFDKCEKGYIPESEGPMWSSEHAYFMTDEVADA